MGRGPPGSQLKGLQGKVSQHSGPTSSGFIPGSPGHESLNASPDKLGAETQTLKQKLCENKHNVKFTILTF